MIPALDPYTLAFIERRLSERLGIVRKVSADMPDPSDFIRGHRNGKTEILTWAIQMVQDLRDDARKEPTPEDKL